jgi:hypothetical protein
VLQQRDDVGVARPRAAGVVGATAREHGGQRGEYALSHFRLTDHHRQLPVGGEAQEAVGMEGR